MGVGLGRLFYFIKASPARVTEKNLEICFPNLPIAERQRLARRSMEETGKTLFEMGAVWEWPVAKTLSLITKVEGDACLQRPEQKGLLILVPHIGNWEVVGLYLASRFSMAALYSPPKLAGFDNYMRGVRERSGSTLVPATQRGVITLFSILKNHGVVGILPDQEPDLSGGVFAPFFGIEANTMKLVSKMVQKTEPKVILCAALREPSGKGFKIVFLPADPEIENLDLEKSVAAMNRSVEAVVNLAPEQYQWEYKRFKRRPGGRPNFYD